MLAFLDSKRHRQNVFHHALKQQAFERETLGEVGALFGTNMKERKSNTVRQFTDDQMARHRSITAAAAEYLFVRESDVFTEYLSSNVGRRLENSRWDHEPPISNIIKFRKMALELLTAGPFAWKGLSITLGLILAVLSIVHQLKSGTSPAPISFHSIDPPSTATPNVDTYLLLPSQTIMSEPENEGYLLDPPHTTTSEIKTDSLPLFVITTSTTATNTEGSLPNLLLTSTPKTEAYLHASAVTATPATETYLLASPLPTTVVEPEMQTMLGVDLEDFKSFEDDRYSEHAGSVNGSGDFEDSDALAVLEELLLAN